MRKVVVEINKLEPEFEKLTDDEAKAKTNEFRERLKNGEKEEDILPGAFATVRKASKRVFGIVADVQLIGGMVLNERCIAEMRTGEGKTLTCNITGILKCAIR